VAMDNEDERFVAKNEFSQETLTPDFELSDIFGDIADSKASVESESALARSKEGSWNDNN
ncbi:hypothetical protein OS493_034806, partial [Desmophyllum pertusum]